jgi:hydroxymethylpyrimidine kinase/phosphomethylpyrimidine kinase/thiamine-phosphate diphosphorylase
MSTTKKPIIWTISGADCSGGAGIAADIKTGHSLGVEVCHLITANTVQNSTSLISVNPTSTDILQQQVDALIIDKPPLVIKVGLLANQEQVNWLVTTINSLKKQNAKLQPERQPKLQVVYDPVGQASVGGKFSILNRDDLLPLFAVCDVLTPNLLEAQYFSENENAPVAIQAKYMLNLGVNSVIIKGGHGGATDKLSTSLVQEFSTDYCLHTQDTDINSHIEYQLQSPRIATSFSHGGGCSFASALSAFLAHGYLLRDAFTLTKAFINQGLSTHSEENDYYGAFEQTTWPKSPVYFPKICASLNRQYANLSAFPSLQLTQRLGLYPVVDSIEWLKRLLPLNLNIIQLRLKNKSVDELEQVIAEAVAISRDYGTRLFINDYWQLAIKHGAYGVHVGQEDLQKTDLAVIQKAGLRLGISTHGCYEFLLAQQLKPSYLAVGAIFPTKTKDMTGQIQGIENLKQLLALTTDIPVVAIGGINLSRASEVSQTGVDAIAVVTAITEAKDFKQAVADFRQRINNAG